MKSAPFATRLPKELISALDEACARFGLRKNFVVENALRERLEDLWDTHDLKEAMQTASGFTPLSEVIREYQKNKRTKKIQS